MPQTKVTKDTYKGKNILVINRVDDSGETLDKYPVISFGLRKAKAIIENVDEIKKFIEEENENAPNDRS